MAKQGEQRKQRTHIEDRVWDQSAKVRITSLESIEIVTATKSLTNLSNTVMSRNQSSRLVRNLSTVLSEAADRIRVENSFLFPPIILCRSLWTDELA